ncbi:ATP dependent DNA ligase domain protein [uncultured archaeon]|nr:ATP dependent DNA ligase domain protein [uncultured archaeon]
MSYLYVSDSALQYAYPIQLVNDLWQDPEWVAEELLSGYRAVLSSMADGNSLFVSKKCCNGTSLGKNLTNNFLHIKNIPIHKLLGDCVFDCVIVSDQKQSMEPLFDLGPLGAENLNFSHGMFKLVLVDIMKFKGVILKDEPWKIRRVYLEDSFRKINSPFVKLIESVSQYKRDFFNSLDEDGSKGIVFKNIESKYQEGLTRNFLEARSNARAGFKNVTLSKSFRFVPKALESEAKSFDFDVYLALQALDRPENIKKLLES